ncbi:aminotransferase class I/II-fold pyridoxal phosphate-dependent enzyme [Xylophilus sp. GOD-11R]|uniref:aminotransferase class I/II-fold pyridoxal phosphate-dependent enzyme n=1 Tax=Xylophilus sp. GOD-11R TaxID=3089814 RepID=UPI00298C6D95|nr:aminotransferase class I/II-fold pyridoxal phosphate-dependent enzyme [Xylophilus sp. GOD-11R]WPB58561.1 aminotransferase class I/II-fold pyridoxal phosphate-dependent enzyme [Xylophilus sp. GOD-11R]
MTQRAHGGPDASGQSPFDFSTNANACGPCPSALAAVLAADARSYPDPAYRALRDSLARHHGVDVARIVPAASASEAILRITARAVQRGVTGVSVPEFAYGDYRHAAEAWSLPVHARGQRHAAGAATLAWACDPSSPLGLADAPAASVAASTLVVDRAYAPLRLSGADPWRAHAGLAWQLWTPNKALGMTGIRAAYLIAPEGGEDEAAALDRLAPSWPIGSHGVAMLDAWCHDEARTWLAQSLDTLRAWKSAQQALCDSLGWQPLRSDANFFVARLPEGTPADLLARLREQGVQLRDCASFGLPGHVRLGVLPPPAQQALADAVGGAAGGSGGGATTMHAPNPWK